MSEQNERPWSTIGKLMFLHETAGLLPIQFTGICHAYGIDISNATISRAMKNANFTNHETSEMLRPLVLKLEDLVQRAKPFPISFADPEITKLVLDVINDGADLSVGTPISTNNSNDSSTTIPAAQSPATQGQSNPIK